MQVCPDLWSDHSLYLISSAKEPAARSALSDEYTFPVRQGLCTGNLLLVQPIMLQTSKLPCPLSWKKEKLHLGSWPVEAERREVDGGASELAGQQWVPALAEAQGAVTQPFILGHSTVGFCFGCVAP